MIATVTTQPTNPPSATIMIPRRAQRKRARRSTIRDDGAVRYATLPDLPVELLFDIASTYPRIHHKYVQRNPRIFPDTRLYFERLDVLRALSRTSKDLRHVFLPLAWECVESYHDRYDHSSDNGTSAYLADKLQRLTIGLLENPNLAVHVQFAFIFDPSKTKPKPKDLIRCLHSLPHLHTLRYERYPRGKPLSYSHLYPKFPSIRTLIVGPSSINYFLPRCPKVKAVTSYGGTSGSKLRRMLDAKAKSLEELNGFTLNERDVEYIIWAAPNLRRITFPRWVPQEIVQSLHPLTRLQSISMTALEHNDGINVYQPRSTAELDAWVAAAVKVLRGNKCSSADKDGKGKKRVNMHYETDYSNGSEPGEVSERRVNVEVE